jgi:hypothetical protein
LKTFVDNVSTQVIENELVWNIWTLFEPKEVAKMDQDLVQKIAAESPESQELRKQLNSKLAKLKNGMAICQRHVPRSTKDLRSSFAADEIDDLIFLETSGTDDEEEVSDEGQMSESEGDVLLKEAK